MAEHPIKGLMETAMQNIKEMVDVNTIVGDAVETSEGTVIIPISKVAFGFGAGGSEFGARPSMPQDSNANFGGGSGGGVSITPVAFMVVGQGQIKLMPVNKNESPASELIEKVPSLLERIIGLIKGKKEEEGACCKGAKEKKEKKEKIETIETVQMVDEK